ncbi:hypothetical protein BH23VER1_BH23VER1_33940 [soil metagenome]
MKQRSLALAIAAAACVGQLDGADAIGTILEIGSEGRGNAAATGAWAALAGRDPGSLAELLAAIGKADAIAANYLRAAAEAVAAEALAEGAMPVAELETFIAERDHGAKARWLAFDLLGQAEPVRAAALVPGFIDDPAPALRRQAVDQLIAEAGGEEVEKLRAALGAAREIDQVKAIAESLKKAGEEVDLPKHFGFLMRWKSVGPFDNVGDVGFDRELPPEVGEVDFGATFEGKPGEVGWQDLVTADRFGMVDLNKLYGPLKGVAAYAATTFVSDRDQPAELRLGCKNAWKVWANGEFLFGRDEYHRGMRIDQYVMPFRLKEGENTVLVKICQDEQEQEWTVEWQFQLRVCDATGTAILSQDRMPTPSDEEATGAPVRRRPPRD